MKILFVIDSLGSGGAERSSINLWYFLQEHGIELEIISLKNRPAGFQQEVLDARLPVTFLENRSFFGQVYAISKAVKQFQPDLVHSILGAANKRTRIARMQVRFFHLESLVNEVYSKYRFRDPNVSWLGLHCHRVFDRLTWRRGVDHFHANGLSVADHYTRELDIPRSKISVVPRGRPANQFLQDCAIRDRIRDYFECGSKTLLILVARHEFQKGHRVLLEAIGKDELLRHHTHLLLVGREGNMTEAIHQEIARHQLGNISILGHRDDVHQLLAASDICVHPTRFEGLPGALIEAEAAGLPIICTDISNNKEVVVEGVNALCFPVDDVYSLQAKLRQLVSNPELCRQLGEQSLGIFNSRFREAHVHDQMLEMYRRLVDAF